MALWKSSALHHRRVEQESARARLHGAGLVVGHALEHLELHEVADALVLAEHEPVGDVEEVVAGDADDAPRARARTAAVLDHALEVGVDLDLVA